MTETNPKAHRPVQKKIQYRRPLPLRLLFWVVLLWVVLGWFRFARVIIDRALILSLLHMGLYWYLLLAGLTWGLVGLPLLWGILQRANWTRSYLWGVALFYPAVYWVERSLLWADPNARQNWPFMLLLTVFWFGLVGWVSQSKKVRHYFRRIENEG